jgi:hypothetical protein
MKKPFGAAWWRESLLLARLRTSALPIGLGGAALVGCVPAAQMGPAAPPDHSVESLGLQRAEAWDVGADRPLALAGAVKTDVSGGASWRDPLDGLFLRLLPARAELMPFYVPTLFQSLVGPGSERLRAALAPIHTAAMDADFARGQALRELFEQAGWPGDTAIVVDAPGPRAVAVAAALADRFDAVFGFGNWPHPLGVVPAHETLAAVLYYLPLFERGRRERPAGAPPLFVLDANRLAPYSDDGARFDNRYLARLPSAAQLAALGVRHVLYVNADGGDELDDLNQGLVGLDASGIDVRVVALADFQLGDEQEYWYGGAPEWHVTFWGHYGWYNPPPFVCHHHRVWMRIEPAPGTPPHVSQAFCHRPQARPTLLGGHGLSHVTVRSGSLGRAGGGHAG